MSEKSLVQLALEEAYASAPQDLIVLDTFEVHHRTFTTPIRVVRYPVTGPKPDIFKLKLEDDAPADAGLFVEFIGCPFDLQLPDRSSDTIGAFQIRVDGLDDQIDEYMENAALDGGPLTAIYREYIQGMESEGPCSIWRGLELENPRIEEMAFVVDAIVLKWAVRPYGRIYTAMEYPGLVVGR